MGDDEYCLERNQFIRFAAATADKEHGTRYPKGISAAARDKWNAVWTQTYLGEMARLWSGWMKAKPILQGKSEKQAAELADLVIAQGFRRHLEKIARKLKMSFEMPGAEEVL